MQKLTLAAAIAATVTLAACGDTRTQRVATGAAGGAVIGHVVDDRPVEGAVVGGVLGALR